MYEVSNISHTRFIHRTLSVRHRPVVRERSEREVRSAETDLAILRLEVTEELLVDLDADFFWETAEAEWRVLGSVHGFSW